VDALYGGCALSPTASIVKVLMARRGGVFNILLSSAPLKKGGRGE
jgi:hypothetical protein